jgi:hypothetical protein
MTSTTVHCDHILALIDECLAEYDATLRRAPTAPVATRPSRHLYLVPRNLSNGRRPDGT